MTFEALFVLTISVWLINIVLFGIIISWAK